MGVETANMFWKSMSPAASTIHGLSYESASPFMALSKGDPLDPAPGPTPCTPRMLLGSLAWNILFSIPGEKIIHKILVFTELVPNTLEGKLE